MVKTGFILNLMGVLLATILVYCWGTIVFQIEIDVFPAWAEAGISWVPSIGL